jgi:hypothetical protein
MSNPVIPERKRGILLRVTQVRRATDTGSRHRRGSLNISRVMVNGIVIDQAAFLKDTTRIFSLTPPTSPHTPGKAPATPRASE